MRKVIIVIGIILSSLLFASCSSNSIESALSDQALSLEVGMTSSQNSQQLLPDLNIDPNLDIATDYPTEVPILIAKAQSFDESTVMQALGVSGYLAMEVGEVIFLRTTEGQYVDRLFNPYDFSEYEGKELEGLSSDSLFQKLKTALLACGINDVKLVRSFGLSHEVLRTAEEASKAGNPDFEEELKNGQEIYKGDWSAADDCYAFELEHVINNLPVYTGNYVKSEQFFINGDKIGAVCSSRGIVSLMVYNINKQTTEKETVTILAPEVILQKVKQKYDNIIITDPIVITKLQLIYFPVPITQEDKQVELVPVWSVTLQSSTISDSDLSATDQTSVSQKEEYQYQLYFNGQSGDEIILN